jgi:rhamnose transport system substrate-binding protein
MSRKRLGAIAGAAIVAAATVLLATGVGSANTNKSAAGYKVFLIPKFIGIPVFTQNGLGAKEAGKKLGDTVVYNGPTSADATAQVTFINSAVRQGAKGIIISADDPNAVAPALKRARARGVKVVTYDADAATSARSIYVTPPSARDLGFAEVQWVGSQIGYKGQIAVLSAAPTAANQNAWIKWMKAALKTKKYKGMKLVKVAYGNDDDSKSAQETQALMQAYPKLKGIIAPTTVGVAAASRVISQAKKCSSVRVTGLGLPNQMRTYVKSGCVKKVGLWSERDFGYLAEYVVHNLLTGKLTGKVGQSFVAGRLGKRTVQSGAAAGYGAGPVVILSKPLVFTKGNIDKYHF